MQLVFNPISGTFDLIGMTDAEVAAIAAAYLKLDQTTPQVVDNGQPKFNKGLEIKADEWLVFDA